MNNTPFYRSVRQKWWWLPIFVFINFTYLVFYTIFIKPNILVNELSQLIVIPRGYTLQNLKCILQTGGYVKHAIFFVWTARLLRYNPQVAPGQYRLSSNMSNWEAIKMLRGSRQAPVKLVFSTASNKEDLVEQITKRVGIKKKEITNIA